MPDDVTFEEVIDAIIESIGEGCYQAGDHDSYRCELSPEAKAFAKRRYKGSIDEKLNANNPGDWRTRHKAEIDKVAFAHGQIAGAMWQFEMRAKPSPAPQVTAEMLAKAGHIMEIECQLFLALKAQARGESIGTRGGYCW